MTEPDSRPPTLIVTGGPQDGASVACEAGTEKILGSDSQADLRMTGANVAATHARLQWNGEHLLLTDAGSPTGTFVNGEKITEPRPLAEGDRVYLGPPGSSDSASLLVCPPVEEKDNFLFDPSPAADDVEPLVLDAPSVAPAFDFLAPSSTATAPPARTAAPPPIILDAEPESASEPIKLKPMSPSPAPPAGPPRKPSKPEYTSEMPSIGGDRVREPVRLPPALSSSKPKTARKQAPGLPLPAILGGVGVLVVLGLGAAYMFLSASPPVLTQVNPTKSERGGTVTLTGEKFASEAAKNTVRFGDKPGQVVSASDTQLSVKVPADAPLGDIQITVQTGGGRSAAVACRLVKTPLISKLEPAVALPGAEIVLNGHVEGEKPTVTIGGREAEILTADATSLRVRVPADLPPIEGKSVPVSVSVGGESSKPVPLVIGHLPLLTEVVPASSAAGLKVTLRGFGFAANAADNTVYFGDRRALVLQAKPTELQVVTPGSDRAGSQITVAIRVDAGGSSSSPRPFILTRSSSGSFVPRFYPETVADHPGHDHVLVLSDLGPLLVLTGPGDAASTGQRGLAVAEGLNAIVDAGLGGKPAAVEMREKPSPCLAVVGAPACLATVTPADVAAYDEKWASDKGARANPRLIAGHWAALVEDNLMLFIRKQRPYRLVETSTRGKVLLEIYAEAVRKVGAGNGVPSSLVSPVPMKWAPPLRDMALILPSGDTQARGAAAIEGLWQGKAQDTQAAREIRVRFRLEGGKPQGTLTTRRGKLSMDVPLTEVSYERGGVRFIALLSGQPTTFQGTLQQGLISGTLQVAGAKEPAGQFSLSFVE